MLTAPNGVGGDGVVTELLPFCDPWLGYERRGGRTF
jgi:hypothetical protein